MSNRQINVTLTKAQQKFVKKNPNMKIVDIARALGLHPVKVSTNMILMGLSREESRLKKINWEKNGFFNPEAFAKLPIP